MKYKECRICKIIRENTPKEEVPDELIEKIHEGTVPLEVIPKKYLNKIKPLINYELM